MPPSVSDCNVYDFLLRSKDSGKWQLLFKGERYQMNFQQLL